MTFKFFLFFLLFIHAFSLNAQSENSIEKNYSFMAEKMPYFLSEECAKYCNLDNESELRKCSEQAMWKFIYSNLKWPAQARNSCIEGTVVIQFVIEKDGSVGEAIIRKNLGGGCGEEALRVVQMMPDWFPASMHERPVPIYYNLPIRFGIDY